MRAQAGNSRRSIRVSFNRMKVRECKVGVNTETLQRLLAIVEVEIALLSSSMMELRISRNSGRLRRWGVRVRAVAIIIIIIISINRDCDRRYSFQHRREVAGILAGQRVEEMRKKMNMKGKKSWWNEGRILRICLGVAHIGIRKSIRQVLMNIKGHYY